MSELQQFGTPTEELPIYDENYFLSQFGEKLCFQRPNSSFNLWVLWSSTDHSSCPSLNSDEIEDQVRSVLENMQLYDLGSPSPDLCYFSKQEHPWWDCVSNSNLRDLYAFPVFDATGQGCTGIIECVAAPETLPRYGFGPIKEYFHDSRVFNLKSCSCFGKIPLNAGDEIKRALEVLRKNDELPLVITWVSCRQCKNYENSGLVLCDITSRTLLLSCWKLLRLDLHFKKGQGVAGKAYLSGNACFCSDITHFSLVDYPLAHCARFHKLAGSFVICLRSSTHAGDEDYVLEFLLPRNETNGYPQTLLDSILATMKQHLPSFKLASGEELGLGLSVEVINLPHKQAVVSVDHTLPHVTAIQDVGIKASYGDSVIKFKLSPKSRMVNLEEEIAKRLRIKSFKIYYWDEEGDKILLPSEFDADLRLCLENSIRLGIAPVKMLVELDSIIN